MKNKSLHSIDIFLIISVLIFLLTAGLIAFRIKSNSANKHHIPVQNMPGALPKPISQ